MNLSKSKYCAYLQCPKRLWLSVYAPQEAVVSADLARRLATGTEVGELARGLFGAFTDVTTKRENGSLDYSAMLKKTQEALRSGVETICEAAFSFDGCYCQVDLLHKAKGGYEIYEVKSASGAKEINRHDVAFQSYVLGKCGVPVTGVYLVCLNAEYTRHGPLDVSFGGLFKRTEELSGTLTERGDVEENVARAKALLARSDEPKTEFCRSCASCDFLDHCRRGLPEPSVLDLASCSGKWEYARRGILTLQDLLASGESVDARVRQQIEHACTEREAEIDREKIREFLSTLWFPLYFLDFETMQSALPPFDGTRPYQQIPFQYSLDGIDEEGEEAKHFEFLAEAEGDPRRPLAEKLVRDIPKDACVIAYNMKFEKTVLKELADVFPDLAPSLLGIRENVRDVMIPFQRRYYYNRAMHGSYSLKSVTPALFPGEEEADYHNLEGVHNGSEAMDVFPRMKEMSEEERAEARRQLLVYCGHDTWNTVKIWQELVRVSK